MDPYPDPHLQPYSDPYRNPGSLEPDSRTPLKQVTGKHSSDTISDTHVTHPEVLKGT